MTARLARSYGGLHRLDLVNVHDMVASLSRDPENVVYLNENAGAIPGYQGAPADGVMGRAERSKNFKTARTTTQPSTLHPPDSFGRDRASIAKPTRLGKRWSVDAELRGG